MNLKREPSIENGKQKWILPLTYNYKEYQMQVTSQVPYTTVITEDCLLETCQVPKKYFSPPNTRAAEQTQHGIKNFLFNMMGQFTEAGYTGKDFNSHFELYTETGPRNVPEITLFGVEDKMRNSIQYSSTETGVFGFGPVTQGHIQKPDSHIVSKLIAFDYVDSNIVTYNIVMDRVDEENKDGEKRWAGQSFIYLGQISDEVRQNTTFVNATSLNLGQFWSAAVSDVFIDYGKTILSDKGTYEQENHVPVPEIETQALFDPQLDYLYVTKDEFLNKIKPVIKQVYPEINCKDDTNTCFWSSPCRMVKRQEMKLSF